MSWFPQVGDTIGRYRITEVLGRGGMGVVFVANSEELDRPVALKVLAPQAALDPQLRERFSREAATLAKLDSPHIVYILDYGEQDGCPYLVTQLVPGGDLRRYLDEHGPLPPELAAEVMAHVAAALEEAHSHGVVHRDLKSANVLLRELPGGRLHAYLCDFGIARADSYETTSSSGVVGTLEYLAPERQSGAPASVATDVYALGCLLWAAVTGAPPYRGSDIDVAMAHLRAPIPRLPGGDPVSRRVNEIVARAMAKQPGDRYPSAHEMRRDLVAVSALAADHDERSATAQVSRRPGRHRALAGLAGLVLAAAVVTAATIWLPPDPGDGDSGAPAARKGGGETSDVTPSAQAGPRGCWDGRVVEEPEDCPVPSGVQGLRWVFPSFEEGRVPCRPIKRPVSRRKVLAYFCPFTPDNQDEGIRYSEWDSASDAQEVISKDIFFPPTDVERDGYTWTVWVRPSADENGWFSSTVAYQDWPFTAEAQSNTKEAAILACNDYIDARAPTTLQPVTSLCESVR